MCLPLKNSQKIFAVLRNLENANEVITFSKKKTRVVVETRDGREILKKQKYWNPCSSKLMIVLKRKLNPSNGCYFIKVQTKSQTDPSSSQVSTVPQYFLINSNCELLMTGSLRLEIMIFKDSTDLRKDSPIDDLTSQSIICEIKQTWFTTTYKAYSLQKNKFYSLTSVNNKPGCKTAVEFLKKEKKILQDLHHKNITNLFQPDSGDSKYCIGLDLVEHGTLEYKLNSEVIPEEVASYIFKQVLEALSYLHSNNVIHLNLTLYNIFIASNDYLCKVKIGNFSASFNISESKGEKGEADFTGPFLYMPPEVHNFWQTNEPIPEKHLKKIDIYSFGVCLFQAIAGNYPCKTPSTSKNFEVLIQKALQLKFSSTSNYLIAEKVLQRCLEYNADNRGTAEDLLLAPWFENCLK